jgi:hypothetical protein
LVFVLLSDPGFFGKEYPSRTFNAWIYQIPESKAIRALANFFTSRGRTVTTLIFDGLHVAPESKDEAPLPACLLRDAEAHILWTLWRRTIHPPLPTGHGWMDRAASTTSAVSAS